MYVARILYPVEVLGPGKRIGIWFCGCPHGCKGCCNPELWEFQERYETSLSTVLDLIKKIASAHHVDGFTISGGEPFFQKEDLLGLTTACCSFSEDVLVYSGYLRSQIPEEYLKNIAVLIDGTYQEQENTGVPLRGSCNQTIHYFHPALKEKYEEYLEHHENQVQLFKISEGAVSVGIHRPDFRENIDLLLKERGVT